MKGPLVPETQIPVRTDEDVIRAREEARRAARALGFGMLDQTRIVTAVSELARNIVVHAGRGSVCIFGNEKEGITVVFRDEGPGIPDVEQAFREGFSTVGSLGLGLPGARKLVDELSVVSSNEGGTTVTVRKRP